MEGVAAIGTELEEGEREGTAEAAMEAPRRKVSLSGAAVEAIGIGTGGSTSMFAALREKKTRERGQGLPGLA